MAAKGKRAKRVADVPASYVVEIGAWDWSYTFGLSSMRHDPDPFMEFRHLAIEGRMLAPRLLKDRKIELTIIPDPDLSSEIRRQRVKEPLAVGSLSRNRGTDSLQGLLSVPKDALDAVLTMLAVSRLKFLVLNGTHLGRGGARIHSYRLGAAVTDDDLYEA